jgi:FeS assembly SUF system protein
VMETTKTAERDGHADERVRDVARPVAPDVTSDVAAKPIDVTAKPIDVAAKPTHEVPAAPTLAQDLANVGMPQSGPTIEPVVSASAAALPAEEIDRLTTEIIAALKTVYDPEIPSDIYELGLIYKIDIDDDRNVAVEMTLTAPGCPVAGEMPIWVENAVNSVPGVASTAVTLTFDPPWDQSRMSDEARLVLNMF